MVHGKIEVGKMVQGKMGIGEMGTSWPKWLLSDRILYIELQKRGGIEDNQRLIITEYL